MKKRDNYNKYIYIYKVIMITWTKKTFNQENK